jgi:lipopolysaccharide heptosyltransferase II
MLRLSDWNAFKNILVIRPDAIGDVIMTTPALRALKESVPERKITLLTSQVGNLVASYIPFIDNVIVYDVPWYMSSHGESIGTTDALLRQLRERHFDGAIIFSVYDKSPLPTALLCYLAGIPRILAYCQENPAQLVSDWIPDPEPLFTLKHEVRRQLDLVREIGCETTYEDLQLSIPELSLHSVQSKLAARELDYTRPFMLLHPGVSMKKRQYSAQKFARAAQEIIAETNMLVLVTGSAAEEQLCLDVVDLIGENAFSVAGLCTFDEFVSLVSLASVVVTNNTATSHVAAAMKTPVVVLYALTNPQHAPWRVRSKVLPFAVPPALRTKSPQLSWVNNQVFRATISDATPSTIVSAVRELLSGGGNIFTDILQF